MNCLENIVSVKDACNNGTTASSSGLDLMDAPEISVSTLANIANEKYQSGLILAKEKVRLATLLVRNDLLSVLGANKILPNLAAKSYTTGEFKPTITFPAEAKERGLTLYKNSRIKGNLRKLKISKVHIYPLVNAEAATFKIYDDYAGGTVSTYQVELVANQINTFNIAYEVKGTFARVLLDGTNISVASTYLTCFTGCNGAMPNDCGYTKGWYADKEISGKEGFGINVEFGCECDYDQLLCDLSKTFVGQLVWLKARVLLLEEHLRTDRLNNWVIYNREETQDHLTDVENQYRTKWSVFADTLPGLLKQYKDDCLVCNGMRWVVNL